MDINDLKNKTVLVLGAGKTGIASANFLIDKASKVLLSESQDESSILQDKIKELKKAGVEFEFNKNSEEFLAKADLVVISPGISPLSNIVKKINSLNKPTISDIELAKSFIHKPIIGVTGTNGKTTTTSLITHLINSSGKKAISCGNIGRPLIEIVNEKIKDIDYYVLEISSFQMFYSPSLSCDIAVCLNITADHLDWHGDFNHYVKTKEKLFLQQKINSWSVLNLQDKIINSFNIKNNKFYFSYALPTSSKLESYPYLAFFENDKLLLKEKNEINEIAKKTDLRILGSHNIENALASIIVAHLTKTNRKNINDGLKTFQGVEHRLEFVRKINNKSFYNDSKATNPEATIKAIEAFREVKETKITLILGGRDKKTSLNEMVKVIKNNVSEVILFGEAKGRFQEELTSNSYKELKIVKNLHEAIETSLKSKTDIVLFSPACSSFDMFKNYEERGNLFRELVSKFETN